MSKFAALTYGKQAGIHFDLIAKGVDFDEKYKITKDNAIVWDTRLIKTVPNDLAVEGTGLGCVVVTVSDTYIYMYVRIHGRTVYIMYVCCSVDCRTWGRFGGLNRTRFIYPCTSFGYNK